MNRNFGKIKNGHIVYFDGTLKDGDRYIVTPTADDFHRLGWLSVVDTPPVEPASEGFHYTLTGWAVGPDGQSAIAQYSIVPDPPAPPRVFSKLKVVAALTADGAWPQVKAWIEANDLYDLYLAAQDFAEDNEYFVSGRAALAAALGWSDEQVEAVLAECVAEG